jgi:hypothetical protein
MKKQFLLQEADVRANNDRMVSLLSKKEQELQRALASSKAEANTSSTSSSARQDYTVSAVDLTVKLLALQLTQLEVEIDNAATLPSPELCHLSLTFVLDDDHTMALAGFLQEMDQAAEKGLWDQRKAVYQKVLTHKAALRLEEERAAASLLAADVADVVQMWVNHQLGMAASTRTLNSFKIDLTDAEIYTCLLKATGSDLAIDPSMTLMSRAQYVLDEVKNVTGSTFLDAPTFAQGGDACAEAHVWMLCSILVMRPNLSFPQPWISTQREKVTHMKRQLDTMKSAPTVAGQQLAIYLADMEFMMNEIKSYADLSDARRRQWGALQHKLQGALLGHLHAELVVARAVGDDNGAAQGQAMPPFAFNHVEQLLSSEPDAYKERHHLLVECSNSYARLLPVFEHYAALSYSSESADSLSFHEFSLFFEACALVVPPLTRDTLQDFFLLCAAAETEKSKFVKVVETEPELNIVAFYQGRFYSGSRGGWVGGWVGYINYDMLNIGQCSMHSFGPAPKLN